MRGPQGFVVRLAAVLVVLFLAGCVGEPGGEPQAVRVNTRPAQDVLPALADLPPGFPP